MPKRRNMFHGDKCDCAKCATRIAKLVIANAKDNIKKTGEVTMQKFTTETRKMLSQDIEQVIETIIARRLEDFLSPVDASCIGADLASIINTTLKDVINDTTDNAIYIVNNFVSSFPAELTNVINKYEMEKVKA